MKGYFWKNILLMCAGVVTGSLVSHITSGIKALSWLAYGLDFGTGSPFDLNLGVLRLTFGVNINITISTIIFVIIFYLIGNKIIK